MVIRCLHRREPPGRWKWFSKEPYFIRVICFILCELLRCDDAYTISGLCVRVSFAYHPSFFHQSCVFLEISLWFFFFFFIFWMVLVRVWWSHSSHNRCWNDICEFVLRSKRVLLFYMCVANRSLCFLFFMKKRLEHSTSVPFQCEVRKKERKKFCVLNCVCLFYHLCIRQNLVTWKFSSRASWLLSQPTL